MTISTLLTLAAGFVAGLCAAMVFVACRRNANLEQKLQRSVTHGPRLVFGDGNDYWRLRDQYGGPPQRESASTFTVTTGNKPIHGED